MNQKVKQRKYSQMHLIMNDMSQENVKQTTQSKNMVLILQIKPSYQTQYRDKMAPLKNSSR